MKNRICTGLLLVSCVACAGTIGPDGVQGEPRERFEQLKGEEWQEVFFDPGTGDW